MREITLTQGKVAIVDDIDYAYLKQWKWHYANGYAKRCWRECGKHKSILMYRVILGQMDYTPTRYLKVKYKLNYCRDILVPPLDLSPGPKEISLTRGKVAIVDLEDYEYLMQWNWYYANGYAFRSGGCRMHRLILERMGFTDFAESDHINHDCLDNQRANLRPATTQQNQGNRRPQEGCSSRYKGVNWHKQASKWQAGISVNGKAIHLGLFDNEEKAATAYNDAAKEHFAEFANLNTI